MYILPVLIVVVVVIVCILFLLDNIPRDSSALDVSVSRKKIILNNELLLTDSAGKLLTTDNNKIGTTGYIEFEVKSTVDEKVKYEIYLNKENADPELPVKFIKVYLTDENDVALNGYNVSNIPTYYDLRVSDIDPSGKLLYSGTLKDKNSKKFRLRMWVSDTYEITSDTKIFSTILNVKVK